MAIVVRSKGNKYLRKTILNTYFDQIGESLLDSFDIDFLVSLRKICGIKSSKWYRTEFGDRYEYEVDIEDDFANEINNLQNQIKFEKFGLWIVYNPGILRITIIN